MPHQDPAGTRKEGFTRGEVCGCRAEVSPGSAGTSSHGGTLLESRQRQEKKSPLDFCSYFGSEGFLCRGDQLGLRQLTYPCLKSQISPLKANPKQSLWFLSLPCFQPSTDLA